MTVAPEAILRAGNETVSWACIFCRDQTLREGTPLKLVNDLMEAVHEVPQMLVDWEHHNVDVIRLHLACFEASRWPGAPDLVSFFDHRLSEYGCEDG